MAQKPSTDKPKRGRKPRKNVQKDEQTTIETTTETTAEPADVQQSEEKAVYNHSTKLRCTTRSAQYPPWLAGCPGVMKPVKTTEGGRMKHWLCSKCGRKAVTEGVQI